MRKRYWLLGALCLLVLIFAPVLKFSIRGVLIQNDMGQRCILIGDVVDDRFDASQKEHVSDDLYVSNPDACYSFSAVLVGNDVHGVNDCITGDRVIVSRPVSLFGILYRKVWIKSRYKFFDASAWAVVGISDYWYYDVDHEVCEFDSGKISVVNHMCDDDVRFLISHIKQFFDLYDLNTGTWKTDFTLYNIVWPGFDGFDGFDGGLITDNMLR